jgi:DNA-binding CsgD family transcriptional regulator
MSELLHLIGNYTIKKDTQIKKICSPLELIGVPFFSYYSIDVNGNFGLLSNYAEQVEFYYAEKLYLNEPYLSCPTLFQSGSVLAPAIVDFDYWDLCYSKYLANHLYLILERQGDSLEGFIFSAPGIKENNVQGLIQYSDLLKKFTKYFKREASTLIGRMLTDRYNILKEKGESFFQIDPKLPLASQNKNREKFLKLMLPLTKREHECLELFKQGKSAQTVASILNLSHRTVEHYYDSIKDKLGVSSKWDLLTW